MKAIILLYLGLEFNSNTFSLCFTLCSCEKMNADQVTKKGCHSSDGSPVQLRVI